MSLTEAMSRIAALQRATTRAGRDGGVTEAAPRALSSQPADQPADRPADRPADQTVDVFISYAMPDDEALAAELEYDLAAIGCKVWRAAGLVGGETLHRAIGKALVSARAVIVLWTPHSIELDWVYSEANRARKRGKLIPMRVGGVDHDDIPPPFDTLQTLAYEDRASLVLALKRLGIEAAEPV